MVTFVAAVSEASVIWKFPDGDAPAQDRLHLASVGPRVVRQPRTAAFAVPVAGVPFCIAMAALLGACMYDAPSEYPPGHATPRTRAHRRCRGAQQEVRVPRHDSRCSLPA